MAGGTGTFGTSSARRFWATHIALPVILGIAAAALNRAFDLDRRLAAAWFFDAGSGTWLGAHAWWATAFMHDGGTAFVSAIGLAALAVVAGGRWFTPMLPWRRKAGFLVLAIALCASAIGLLKIATNVDCPRDLADFGGSRPYVHLFERRPASLPRAACFPGSHSSTAFSLMAFYFMLVETRPRLARIALAAALGLGTLFSLGQQARGSHFLSHDVTSAFLDWFLLMALWRLLLSSPAATPSRLVSRGPGVQQLITSAPRAQGHERRE